MRILLFLVVCAGPGLAAVTIDSRIHTIRLIGNSENGEFRFSPAQVTASRGDTLAFVAASGGPHSLGLDPAGVPPAAQEAWNQAFSRRTGRLRSPLLRDDQAYQLQVPRGTPPGKYRFFCLAHRAYDMRLEVEVK